MKEGIAGHVAAAGTAVAAVGDRAAALGGELVAVGGELEFSVLGLAVGIALAATQGGGVRMRCAIPAGGEAIIEVPADGVRQTLADVAGYLEALGDLSVQADAGEEVRVPGLGGWPISCGSQDRAG